MKNIRISSLLGSLFVGLAASSFAAPAQYAIDKAHSSVGFKVRHLLVQTVGSFEDFDATVHFEPGKLETLKVDATVNTKTINTNNSKRDEHLRSPDFFEAEKYPAMTLTKTKVTDVSGNKAKLHGDLTLRGVTKPVVFELEYLGNVKLDNGVSRAAFTAETRINRKDFGLTWNKALEAGTVMVGEEVRIELNIAADEVAAPSKSKKKS